MYAEQYCPLYGSVRSASAGIKGNKQTGVVDVVKVHENVVVVESDNVPASCVYACEDGAMVQ